MSTDKESRSPTYAFFSLKTQFENVGDALINRELVRQAAKYSVVSVDVSRCPGKFLSSMAFDKYAPDIRLASTIRLFASALHLRLRRRRVYYFLSPGGYVGTKKGLELANAIVNTAVLMFLRLLGVRICHVGASFERLSQRYSRLLAFRSRLLYRTIVRDADSAAYARAVGIRVDGIMPDLAFAAGEYRAMYSRFNSIAISFRVDQSPRQLSAVANLVRRMDEELPGDIPFRFIAQVGRDVPFMKSLSSESYRAGRMVELLTPFDDVDRAFYAYAGCNVVVSNRLHSLLMGFISGACPIPVIDEDFNGKVANLFASLGLPTYRWDLRLDRLKSERGGSNKWDSLGVVHQQRYLLEHTFKELFE